MRIDKFLKVSRILKRRTVANSACELNRVFVNGKCVKPAHRVKVSDEVRIEFGNSTLEFTVMELNEKASKEDAVKLYKLKG